VIRYDVHAEFQIERRRIQKEWIEDAIRNPDAIEERGGRRSYLKRFPGRRVMLRVVTPLRDLDCVITAYFDRTKPCT